MCITMLCMYNYAVYVYNYAVYVYNYAMYVCTSDATVHVQLEEAYSWAVKPTGITTGITTVIIY